MGSSSVGHVVALIIAPALDFHWYRRDRDGMRRTRLTAAASRRPTRLGYRGFLIDRPGAVPGTRDITIVHAGVVGDVRLTSTEHRADADGIEDDLREQAVRRGFGDLLS
jgi:hypothetical protein